MLNFLNFICVVIFIVYIAQFFLVNRSPFLVDSDSNLNNLYTNSKDFLFIIQHFSHSIKNLGFSFRIIGFKFPRLITYFTGYFDRKSSITENIHS